jgi:gliding motility-associated-like protein
MITVMVNPIPVFSTFSLSICSNLAIGFTFPLTTTPAVSSWKIIDAIIQAGLIPSNTNFQIAPNGPTTTANLSAIANDSFTNTTNTSKTVTYKVIPLGSNDCLGDTFNIVVTILPEPFLEDISILVCPNLPINFTFPSSIPPLNIQVASWNIIDTILDAGLIYVPSNASIGITPNVNAIFGDTFINTSDIEKIVTYKVIPVSINGCSGDTFNIVVTILPNIISIFVNGDPINDVDSILVCSGEDFNLNLTSNSSLTPKWRYIPSIPFNNNLLPPLNPLVQFSSTITSSLTNTVNTTQHIEYEVQFINALDPTVCPSLPDTIHVFILPEPTITPIDDIVLCHNEDTNSIPVNININNGIINWFHTGDSIGLPYISDITLLSPNEIPGFTSINNGTSIETLIIHLLPSYTDTILPSNISKTCTGEEELVEIIVNPVPSVFDVNDILLFEGELSSSIILLGTLGGTVFNWVNSNVSVGLSSSGNGNIPVFTAQNPTLLPIQSTVTVTPLFGIAQCPGDSISFDITVKPAGDILYVPNSFTPNDDEKNQDFLPIITAGYKLGTYRLSIYNRWGENVFESYDPNVGWNGTYGQSGIDCEIGIYTYVIELEVLQNQEIKKFIGHVNLIR